MLYHHLMKGTEVPDGDTQWVRVEHLDADHGPSESPPKPNLGAMEHSSCLLHLGRLEKGVVVDSFEAVVCCRVEIACCNLENRVPLVEAVRPVGAVEGTASQTGSGRLRVDWRPSEGWKSVWVMLECSPIVWRRLETWARAWSRCRGGSSS